LCKRLVFLTALLTPCLGGTPSYFQVQSPVANSTWTSTGLNVVRWVSANEGITSFDMHLIRLSTDGILPIAMTVPTSWFALNIYLEDTPPGSDYYLVFLNSADSSVYSISPRFQILSNGTASPTGAVNPKNGPIATVTVSGSPNPTRPFAQTFAVSGASSLWGTCPRYGWIVGTVAAVLFITLVPRA